MAKRTASQTQIPGVEVSDVPEIRDAAEAVLHFGAELAEAKEGQETAIEELLSLMREHRMDSYRLGSFVFYVEQGAYKLKVKEVGS